jgi:hypothetical protein
MKFATLVTFVVAAVLFSAMALVQRQFELMDFRTGTGWSYTADSLGKKIKEYPSKPPLVVVPLLFPLDFLFLVFFGVFLALCSITYADALAVAPSRAWLLLILPIAYMVADFSENVLYSGMMLWPDLIPRLLDATLWVTRLKWLVVILAMLQAVGAFVLSWRH